MQAFSRCLRRWYASSSFAPSNVGGALGRGDVFTLSSPSGVSSALLVAHIFGVAQDPMFAPGYLRAIWKIKGLGGIVQINEVRGRCVYVYLNGPQVTDAELACFEKLPELFSLRLIGTNISDVGLTHLKGATILQHLDLARTKVTDAGLSHLKGLRQLRSLDLGGTKVTDAGIEYLQGLTELESLNLETPR